MKKYINGQYVELTPEEIADITVIREREEQEYWQSISYDEAVDAEIRKKYSASQEFAILRQKEEKPDEYAEYYSYCEECKAFVKERKGLA
jgi:hypothetical protein